MDSSEASVAEPEKGKHKCRSELWGDLSGENPANLSLSFQEKNSLHFRSSRIQVPLGTISVPEMTVHLMTYLPWPDPASPAIFQSNPPAPPDPPDPPDCRGSPNPTQISSHRAQKLNRDLLVICGVCAEKMATIRLGFNRTWPSLETPPVPARLQPCTTSEVKPIKFNVGLNWVGLAHWAIRYWARPMRRRSTIEAGYDYAYLLHNLIN